jgi:dihydrofolate reductase
MRHVIFSNTLKLENPDPKLEVKPLELEEITNLQNGEATDIYLCGGGQFAGWLLENEKIDILKVKLNPLILGDGIRLFGDSTKKHQLHLLDTTLYDNGLQIITYRIDYGTL